MEGDNDIMILKYENILWIVVKVNNSLWNQPKSTLASIMAPVTDNYNITSFI